MVETKTPEYWEAIAKQGDIDKKLKKQIQPLFTQYHEYLSESIFEKNSDKFTDTFQKELDTTLDEFFSSYSELSKNEIRQRKRNHDIHRQKMIETVYFLCKDNSIACKIPRKSIFLDLNDETKGILQDGREVHLKTVKFKNLDKT